MEFQMPPVPQALTTPKEQTPVCAMQQVPMGGWGQGLLGAQGRLSVQVLAAPVHPVWAVWVHAPVTELQQDPCGGPGQMLGEQLPLSVQTFGTPQLGWVAMKHPPVTVQQLPLGGPQGLGEQVRLAVQTLAAAQ